MFDLLFTPVKIGSVELKNRFSTLPMDTSYTENHTGFIGDQYVNYYEARAKGGFGLILTEYTAVDELGKGSVGEAGIWCDEQIAGHKRLVDAVHKHDAKIFIQLHHAGAQAWPAIGQGKGSVSSSPLLTVNPMTAFPPVAPMPIPHELTTDEVKAIERKFIEAGVRAKKAGYDGCELHGANGYFLQQFLSAFDNKRTDEYGGNLYNRTRIIRNIICGIKEANGADFPVTVRISLDEGAPGGNNLEENKAIAVLLEGAGADALDTNVGGGFAQVLGDPVHQVNGPTAAGRAFTTELVGELKKVVSVPVFAANRINDPYLAESIIRSGKADIIALGRASLADPEFPNKVKEGRVEEITHCIGCLQGCQGRCFQNLPIACILNPTTGREAETKITPAEKAKKVFIAGGGVGGMEAAIVAAKRGHDVELFEASNTLGGQFILAGVAPNKQEYNSFIPWQKYQLKKLGVRIHMNTELTEEIVAAEKPDAVIIATGAVYGKPPIKGVDLPHVVVAPQILKGEVVPGMSVVIIGGGHVGCETADFLCVRLRGVTIVEMQPAIGQGDMNFYWKMIDFNRFGVKQMPSTKVLEITEEGVRVECGGEEKLLPAQTVVIATGTKPVNTLEKKLEGLVDNVVVIGDAKKVGMADDAIYQGYMAALNI